MGCKTSNVQQSQAVTEQSVKTADAVITGTESTESSNETIEDAATVAEKAAARRRLIVVTSAITGSGTIAGGAYFFLKRNRLLEEILKYLFKK